MDPEDNIVDFAPAVEPFVVEIRADSGGLSLLHPEALSDEQLTAFLLGVLRVCAEVGVDPIPTIDKILSPDRDLWEPS